MNKIKEVGLCVGRHGEVRKFGFNKEIPTEHFLDFELKQLKFVIDDDRKKIVTNELIFLQGDNDDVLQVTFTNNKKTQVKLRDIKESKVYKSMLDGEHIIDVDLV